MASRYDPHAKLIEDLYAQGESFTSIARRLETEFKIPLDASGLRRWLLRRIAKRDQRKTILSSSPQTPPAAEQQSSAVERIKKEEPKKEDRSAAPPKSMEDLIAESQSGLSQSLLRK